MCTISFFRLKGLLVADQRFLATGKRNQAIDIRLSSPFRTFVVGRRKILVHRKQLRNIL